MWGLHETYWDKFTLNSCESVRFSTYFYGQEIRDGRDMELAWCRRQYVKGFNLRSQREADRRLRELGKRTCMNRWHRIKNMLATCCNTFSALWGQCVNAFHTVFSTRTYCSYFPEKHRLVFIMETDFVHCAVRIKFLYAIWNNFSKTSLWEIFYSVCHPEVFNTYINIQWCISQTQQNFIMFIIVLGWHVSIPIESSSGPSKNTDPYLAMGDLWWTNWQWERFFLPVFRLVETLRYKPQVPWVRFPMAPLT